jgi:hypothetical protein
VRRASFENVFVTGLNLSQILDTRLKISNVKLSANGNAGGTLMLGYAETQNLSIW